MINEGPTRSLLNYWEAQEFSAPVKEFNLYKITKLDYNSSGVRWGTNVSHCCDKDWIIAYTHPVIACLLCRAHFSHDHLRSYLLWECSGEVKYVNSDCVAACTSLKTENIVNSPILTTKSKVKYSFVCTAKVCKDSMFQDWMLDWTGGKNNYIQARRVADHCFNLATVLGMSSPEGIAAYAGHWTAWASAAFDDMAFMEHYGVIDEWAAWGVLYASIAAKRLNLDNFDLVKMVEITMAAK